MKVKALAAASLIVASTGSAQSQEVLEMTSAFGKNLPILGTAAVAFVDKINGISEGVEFEHFDPGELVPTLEALDAVSSGSVDAAYTTSGYWQGWPQQVCSPPFPLAPSRVKCWPGCCMTTVST